MRAIIPVAGFGSRMRPHTHTVPKVLMQVAGKPMLDHIIDMLTANGVDGVTLIVGHMADKIEAHVRRQYGHLDLHFIPQPEMLGLGHAISLGGPIHRKDEKLLIILGDTILKADFAAMFASADTVIGVKEVDDPRRFGVIELAGDRIKRMLEKPDPPPTNLAIVGVYMIGNPGLLFEGLDYIIKNDIRTKKEYQLTDALQWMIERGHAMRPFVIDAWLDCGKPETILETNRLLLEFEQKNGATDYAKRFPRSIIVPPVSIGANCTIEESIVGPFVAISENCKLSRAVVRDCIINKGATLTGIHLHDSLVGEDAVAEGGSHSLNIGDHSAISLGSL